MAERNLQSTRSGHNGAKADDNCAWSVAMSHCEVKQHSGASPTLSKHQAVAVRSHSAPVSLLMLSHCRASGLRNRGE